MEEDNVSETSWDGIESTIQGSENTYGAGKVHDFQPPPKPQGNGPLTPTEKQGIL
jgi:hypothetical protein